MVTRGTVPWNGAPYGAKWSLEVFHFPGECFGTSWLNRVANESGEIDGGGGARAERYVRTRHLADVGSALSHY